MPQPAQLMRNGRFAHGESFCQRADAQLAFQQKGNDAHAAGVAEGAEELGQLDGLEFV